MDTQSCDVKSVTSLTRALTADDDNREWRCRLRHTDHESLFVAAVQCDKGRGCSGEAGFERKSDDTDDDDKNTTAATATVMCKDDTYNDGCRAV